MTIDKQKYMEKPDLRYGVEGSVLINDTNKTFAGRSSNTTESGPAPVGPASVCPPQVRRHTSRWRLPKLSEAIRIELTMEVA
jgi:hypothetical protein